MTYARKYLFQRKDEKKIKEKEGLTTRRATGVVFCKKAEVRKREEEKMERAFEVGGYQETVGHVLRVGRPERMDDDTVTAAAWPPLPFAIITATRTCPFHQRRRHRFIKARKIKIKAMRIPLVRRPLPPPLGSPGSTLREKPQVSSLRVGGTE
ncbi:UNVERIFIED_CONTAM: hypothetical protein Sradi_0316000 [Sesamum radiatum]|uniref:Uncharacterized protein n=1 Tax=Sesamum radiatum TaxID=300843 RepID=A0AAW2W5H7_SESRA